MNAFNLTEPRVPDYYADLGLEQQANFQDIKVAFFRLAKAHHPDKKAPGKSHRRPRIKEAYECLRDKARRLAYDEFYFDLRDQWARYREWQDTQRRNEEQKRAEEDARQRRATEAERARRMEAEHRAAEERAEQEKKAAEAARAQRMEEENRAATEKEERGRKKDERERQAEERSREAARKAREQHELAAKARLRREKEREAGERSTEVARRNRVERERVAKGRLKNTLIQEKQDTIRHNWATMRAAAERQEAERPQARPPTSRSPECSHPQLGWQRKTGRATFCSFNILGSKTSGLSPKHSGILSTLRRQSQEDGAGYDAPIRTITWAPSIRADASLPIRQ
ncbi:hypothetical protein EV126DRAFT_461021 [Verticillium dahliae]|nr:hypothetical protein EV126DRAFT_461021 [Verticillium dahliae]